MCNKCPTPELAREHQQKAAAGRIKKSKDRYYSNPKICLNCLILLSYEKYKSDRQRKFCSQSCSAKFNNKNKNKEIFLCLNCNKSIKRNRKYCNNKCQSDYEYTKVIDEWKSGKRSGLV